MDIFPCSCAYEKTKKSPSNLHKKIAVIKTKCVNCESCVEIIEDINTSKKYEILLYIGINVTNLICIS